MTHFKRGVAPCQIVSPDRKSSQTTAGEEIRWAYNSSIAAKRPSPTTIHNITVMPQLDADTVPDVIYKVLDLPLEQIEDTVTPKAAHSPIVHHHNVERQVANRPSLAGCRRTIKRLQLKMLMRVHGLIESQAQAIAVLIWGAS